MSMHVEWLDAKYTQVTLHPNGEALGEGVVEGEVALLLSVDEGAAIHGTTDQVREVLQRALAMLGSPSPRECTFCQDLASGECTCRHNCGHELCSRPWRTYDHDARPDDDPTPGDRCKHCGEDITWLGPSHYDWLHVDAEENA